ncbi:MAG: hypothetical protein QXX07_03600 [Candidatus Aenigmatarchaeota archaeon]
MRRVLCLFGVHKLERYPRWISTNIWSFWSPESREDKSHYTGYFNCEVCGKLVKKKLLDVRVAQLFKEKHYENVSDPEDYIVFYELHE